MDSGLSSFSAIVINFMSKLLCTGACRIPMMSGSAVLVMSYMFKSVLQVCLEYLTLLVTYYLDVALKFQRLQRT